MLEDLYCSAIFVFCKEETPFKCEQTHILWCYKVKKKINENLLTKLAQCCISYSYNIFNDHCNKIL